MPRESATFSFLGTGASLGIPVVTCHCGVCTSSDPRNQRLRPSGLISWGERKIVIDAGPDFRQQALRYDLKRVDGVILTHVHYDHVAGLDDVRAYYLATEHHRIPCLLSEEAYHELKLRSHYLFNHNSKFECHVIPEGAASVKFCGLVWRIVSYTQLGTEVTGYRTGSFAYVMDLKEYEPRILPPLQGVDTLVMSGLRWLPSRAHLSIEEALGLARDVGARETWFSHISHELEHTDASLRLPQGAKLAYDGLEIEIYVERTTP